MTDIDRIDTAADGDAPVDVQLEHLAREHERIDWHEVEGVTSAGVSQWVTKLLNANQRQSTCPRAGQIPRGSP